MGVTRAVPRIRGRRVGQGVQKYVSEDDSLVLEGESDGDCSKSYHFRSLDVVLWARYQLK